MLERNNSLRFFVLALVSMTLASCTRDVPPTNCDDPDLDCYSAVIVRSVGVVRDNIQFWSNLQLSTQITIVVLSIITTVMLALQGDSNKHWTRPLGIVSTTLAAALTSALVSFHVPDNIDKLISVAAKMSELANQFDYDREKLVGGRDKQQIEKAFKDDSKFRDEMNDMTLKLVIAYGRLKIDLLKIYGTSARLNLSGMPDTPVLTEPRPEPAKKE